MVKPYDVNFEEEMRKWTYLAQQERQQKELQQKKMDSSMKYMKAYQKQVKMEIMQKKLQDQYQEMKRQIKDLKMKYDVVSQRRNMIQKVVSNEEKIRQSHELKGVKTSKRFDRNRDKTVTDIF